MLKRHGIPLLVGHTYYTAYGDLCAGKGDEELASYDADVGVWFCLREQNTPYKP